MNPMFALVFPDQASLTAALAKLSAVSVSAPAPPAAPPPPPGMPTAAPLLPVASAIPPVPAPLLAPVAPSPAPAPAPVAPPPLPAGGIDKATVIQSMAAAVGKPGGAAKVAAIVARYNASQPGVPGTIDVVDPVQYGNIKGELDAIT